MHLMGLIHEFSTCVLIKTHLENSPPEQCLMQTDGAGHRVSIRELYICKAAKKKKKR